MGELRDAEPIVFDPGCADRLVGQFRATASVLRSQVPLRFGSADRARHDWRGVSEVRFGDRMGVYARDSERLAAAMDRAAAQVQELARLARDEQDRRTRARAWKVEHDAWQRSQDDRSLLEQGWDVLSGDDEPKPPNLSPATPPTIPIHAPAPAGRK